MTTVGRGADQYTVRFPEGLRDRIKAAADANGRSMNTEIIARLEATFTVNVKMLQAEIAKPTKNAPPNDDQTAFILTAEEARAIQEAILDIKEELRKMRENAVIIEVDEP